MTYYKANMCLTSNDIQHFGVPGMKWGVRRFQNEDGTLTKAGERRRDEIEGYKKQGLNQKQAEEKADNRRKLKTALIAGGTTIALAGTAYALYKYHDYSTDKIIKSGTDLQVMVGHQDNDYKNRAFYAAYKNSDKKKYEGLYGNQLAGNYFNGGRVYKDKVAVKQELKVMSTKKTKDLFNKMMSEDDEFKKQVIKAGNQWNDTMGAIGAKKHKVGSYDSWNAMLSTHDDENQKQINKFYDKIKRAGYDGIVDLNDKKYSGYNAKSPVIFMNNLGDKVEKTSGSLMDNNYIQNRAAQETMKLFVPQIAEMAVGGAAGGYAGKKYMDYQNIKTYKELHPKTQMTDKEISEMLKGDRNGG